MKQSLTHVSIPFLKNKKSWPRIALKEPETVKFGYSEDELLAEDAIKELLKGIDAKDHKMMIAAIEALVEIIQNKYMEDEDVADSLEGAEVS